MRAAHEPKDQECRVQYLTIVARAFYFLPQQEGQLELSIDARGNNAIYNQTQRKNQSSLTSKIFSLKSTKKTPLTQEINNGLASVPRRHIGSNDRRNGLRESLFVTATGEMSQIIDIHMDSMQVSLLVLLREGAVKPPNQLDVFSQFSTIRQVVCGGTRGEDVLDKESCLDTTK